jgi:hypothetical protein
MFRLQTRGSPTPPIDGGPQSDTLPNRAGGSTPSQDDPSPPSLRPNPDFSSLPSYRFQR